MSEAPRDAFARYRADLEALGFRPSSARGQNFLLDSTLHRVIAEAAAPGPGVVVLEIGVGLGFLTRELAARCRSVVGVEIDERLHAIATRELAGCSNVQIVLADALGGPGRTLDPGVLQRVAAELGGDAAGRPEFAVAANLPYSISGPLLAELVIQDLLPDRAVVLVQRELGDRLAAGVGSEDYGSLSALVQSTYAVRALRVVPPDVFRPRPKVESRIVLLELRRPLPLPAARDRREFARFVRVLFQQRRKTMRTTLAAAAAAIGRTVPSGGFADRLHLRAEALAPDELAALWQQVAGS